MDPQLDQLYDRRSTPRIDVDLPAWYSDYSYEWEGKCASISLQGCFIACEDPFEVGKDIEVRMVHPDGDELKLDAIVRWNRQAAQRVTAGMGIVFDIRQREAAELSTDFVERLALEDLSLASRYRDALKPMSIMTVMHFARAAPENPVLTDSERSFLAWVDGKKDLREIRDSVGPQTWEVIRYAPFSLRGKGVLTSESSLAGSPPSQKKAAGPIRSLGAAEVASRNTQAHAHFERAIEALDSGDKRRGITELRLAMMLAPGDAEITDLLFELESEP